jgi:PLP dependent protein
VTQRSQIIAEAVGRLRNRLDALGGSSVRIIAVAKGFPWVDVRSALDAGVDAVGENYAQEIVDKYRLAPLDHKPPIHFIGRLQSNKIGALAPFVSTWQTVDRSKLLDGIAHRSPGAEVLIQVNTTAESGKGGCSPDEVEDLVAQGRDLGLMVSGLMVIGPTSGDRDETKAAFTRAAQIRERLGLAELSMGMSADLDLAVELGTTMVRVGSALFGGRPPNI